MWTGQNDLNQGFQSKNERGGLESSVETDLWDSEATIRNLDEFNIGI